MNEKIREEEMQKEIEKIEKKLEEFEIKEKGIKTIQTIDDVLKFVPKPTEVKKVSLIYEKIETKFHPLFGTIEPEVKFKVFKASLGTGQKPIFIITKPNQNILENSKLVLKPLDKETIQTLVDSKLVDIFLKSLKLKVKEEEKTQKFFEEIGKNEYFFEPIDDLPNLLFNRILEMENSLKKIFDKVLPKDKIDERIYWHFHSKFLNFASEVKPALQRFQTHSLLITPTKVGKTTIATYLFGFENVYDAGKASRFLGFSSAEESYPSDLDGKIEPTFLDDIASTRWEKLIFDALPNLMENGFCNVAKGGVSLIAKTLTSFTFATNTKKLEKDISPRDLLLDFESFINQFTESPQRIGSRLALILFGNDIKQVQGRIEFEENIIWLWKQICKKLSKKIEKLLEEKKVIELLDKRIEPYERQIDFLVSKLPETSVKSFWNGQKEAYRHINGLAFILSFLEYSLENQKDLIEDEFDFQKLEEFFNEWQSQICEWNLKSLEKMVEIIPEEEEYLKLKFDSIQTEYVKILIRVVAHYMQENRERYQKDVLIPFDMLKPSFEVLPEESKSGRYSHFSRLKQKIPKDLNRLNLFLIPFGIELQFAKLVNIEDIFLIIRNDKLLKIVNYILPFGIKQETPKNVDKPLEVKQPINGEIKDNSPIASRVKQVNRVNEKDFYPTYPPYPEESKKNVSDLTQESKNQPSEGEITKKELKLIPKPEKKDWFKELLVSRGVFGDKIPRLEIESRFPEEIVKKFLRDGYLIDLGDFFLLNLKGARGGSNE